MALEDKKKNQPEKRDELRSGPADRRGLNTVSTTSYVPARILWPALGFPGVVHPIGHTALGNATNQVHLLIASSSASLSAREVSAHLRYVPWSKRRERYSRGAAGEDAFFEHDINVMEVKPDARDDLAEQVRFGGGWVVANLANRVRHFLSQRGLSHLYAISISEKGTSRLTPETLYNLYWNSANKAAKETDVSDEMRMLLDGYAGVEGGNEPAAFTRGTRRNQRAREKYNNPESKPNFVVPLRDPKNQFRYMLQEYEYEYGADRTPYSRTEVLHPLFVRTPRETIRLAHLTDVHCDTRHEVYARNLAKDPSIKNFNNWNETFKELYWEAKRYDAILLTGDLIEFGRGHMENNPRPGGAPFTLGDDDGYWRDRNWFLFYTLLAGGMHESAYTTPVYTTLGNHDWRVNPYGPEAPGSPSPSDLNLADASQIKTAWGPDFGPVGDTIVHDVTKAEHRAVDTTVDSVAWYLLLINPFFDYVAQYPAPVEPTTGAPQRYSFLLLDWANEEDTRKYMFFSRYEKVESESAHGWGIVVSRGAPWAKNALTKLQKEATAWFLTQERTAKVVGAHWGVISPRPSWPQDAMLDGLIDPCPICNGEGTREDAVSIREVNRPACPCVKAFQQTPGRRTRHPIIAFGNPGGLSEGDLFKVQPRWGSLVENREWFIQALADSDVSVVLCGHNHRNSAFFIRENDGSGDGRRAHEAYLKGLKVGSRGGVAMTIPENRLAPFKLDGLASKAEQRPVFVNTVCGGPHATDRVKAGTVIPGAPQNINKGKTRGRVQVAPGFRTIELAPNGEVQSIKVVSSTRLPITPIPAVDVVQ
jgi:Calcineurin-like phosphoesterase